MYASIVNARIQPGRLDAAVAAWHESVRPNVRQLPGCLNSYLLADRAADTIVIVTLYETEAHALAARQDPGHQDAIAPFMAVVAAPLERGLYDVAGVSCDDRGE